jgi:4-hydroxymandelate oxidase
MSLLLATPEVGATNDTVFTPHVSGFARDRPAPPVTDQLQRTTDPLQHVTLPDLQQRARELLPDAAYAYYVTGAGPESTLAANLAAWSEVTLRPRVLRDVSRIDLSTTVLGEPVPHPILVAPTASHRLGHPDGELATARGAARANSLMVISTRASVTLEAIAAAAPNAQRWFQVYVMRDRAWTAELLQRAEAAGATALMLTGDTPHVASKRQATKSTLLDEIRMANRPSVAPVDPDGERHDPSLTFDVIAWLREQSGLPVIVKGVLRGDDARRCLEAGASAVVVSNHGGRQLDGAIATARALPEVVAAVGDDGEVYVDGGIRTGVDVLRALALGARAVLIGRPVLWGLVTGGADGVAAVLQDLRDELHEAAALAGAASVAEITDDLLAQR